MYNIYTKMLLTIEQLKIQQIQDEIDDMLEIWIHKNIDIIIIDFDLSYAKYIKSLIKQNPTNFTENVANNYLNELILRIFKNRQDQEERAKKYQPYSKKSKA